LLSEDAPKTRVQFRRVDVFASARSELRVAFEDPARGTFVSIARPGSDSVVVDQAGCPRFEAKLQQSGAMIVDHWVWRAASISIARG
jgi:hypothetical protein